MTDKKIRNDINAIVAQDRTLPALGPAQNAPPQPSKRGMATTPQASSGGDSAAGGISGPLTEQDYLQRAYYESSYFLSGDLLVELEVKPLRSITFTDSEGETLVMSFAEPTE